jgi:hypothetical protein
VFIRRAGDRDQAVVAEDHAGRAQPVHREERRHQREPAADDHRAAVAFACADGRQGDGGCGGDERAHADAVEVHPERN